MISPFSSWTVSVPRKQELEEEELEEDSTPTQDMPAKLLSHVVAPLRAFDFVDLAVPVQLMELYVERVTDVAVHVSARDDVLVLVKHPPFPTTQRYVG